MKKYYIYTLDYNGYPFYIGKTIDLKTRLRKHKSESKLCRTHKEKFINKILMNNENITITLLDEVDYDKVDFWEIYWISQFRQWNIKLYNLTEGGEGGDNWSGRKHSEETKNKLRTIMLNRLEQGFVFEKCIGVSNGRSKLNEDKVLEIRGLREDKNISYKKLSLQFGVSKQTIIDICKRKKWKHI